MSRPRGPRKPQPRHLKASDQGTRPDFFKGTYIATIPTVDRATARACALTILTYADSAVEARGFMVDLGILDLAR